jgi:hypothetical protein
MDGKEVGVQQVENGRVDCSMLTTGVYTLRFVQGDRMYYGKFLKE